MVIPSSQTIGFSQSLWEKANILENCVFSGGMANRFIFPLAVVVIMNDSIVMLSEVISSTALFRQFPMFLPV